MPSNDPPMAIGQSMQAAAQEIAVSGTPPAAFYFLEAFSTLLNAFLGLSITIIALAFAVYLVRWIMAPDGSDSQKKGAVGAFRAFLALFLVVNVWAIMALISGIVSLSPLVSYGVVILFSVLLFAWSLFGITESFLALLAQFTDWLLDYAVRWVQKMKGSTAHKWQPGKWSRSSLRLAVLGVVFLALILVF